MDIKELTALVEEAIDKKLTPESLKSVIGDTLTEYLKAQPAKLVGVGMDHPELQKSKTVSFSQFLGDVRRAAAGGQMGPPKFMRTVADEKEDKRPLLIKADTGIDPDRLMSLAPELAKALYEGSSGAGGYLVPTEESRELLDLTAQKYSVVPGLCRQVPMRTHQITFPTLTGGVTVYWIPETTADKDTTDPSGFAQSSGFKPPSSPTFGQLTITAHVCAVKVIVSNQLLDDSDPGVDAFLRSIFAEYLGQGYDVACLRGAGSTTDPITGLTGKVTTNLLAAGANADFDDLVDLIGACEDNAPAAATEFPIIGHAKAKRVLMKVKDNQGQYIYSGPRESGDIPRVWGEPLYRNGNVLTNLGSGSNETRLFCGDFANSAFAGRRAGVVVKANPWAEPYFSHNQTAFLAEFRVGFNVSLESRFAISSGWPTS